MWLPGAIAVFSFVALIQSILLVVVGLLVLVFESTNPIAMWLRTPFIVGMAMGVFAWATESYTTTPIATWLPTTFIAGMAVGGFAWATTSHTSTA